MSAKDEVELTSLGKLAHGQLCYLQITVTLSGVCARAVPGME
jgi:hypothetical protein